MKKDAKRFLKHSRIGILARWGGGGGGGGANLDGDVSIKQLFLRCDFQIFILGGIQFCQRRDV